MMSSFLVVKLDILDSDDDTLSMAKALPAHRAVMTAKQIRSRVRRGGERFWRHTDFAGLPPAAVSQALSRLTKRSELERVRKGLYYRSRPTVLGASRPAPDAVAVHSARGRLHPAGLSAAKYLGFTTQNPARPEYASSAAAAPSALAGAHVYTRRPLNRENLSERESAILEVLRDRARTSDLDPEGTCARLLDLLNDRRAFERLAQAATDEPPRVARCSAPPASSSGWTSMCLDDSEPASTRSRATTSAPSADACRLPTAGRQRGEEISLSPSDLSRAWRCTNGSTMLLFHSNLAPAMMRSRPEYELAEVACLARERRVIATRRVVGWLMNHDYDAAETLIDVLTSLEINGRWVGSAELKNGEVADAYVVAWSDEDWYVKFYVDGAEIVVNVWSCCWDGAVH